MRSLNLSTIISRTNRNSYPSWANPQPTQIDSNKTPGCKNRRKRLRTERSLNPLTIFGMRKKTKKRRRRDLREALRV
jgi:hypothetical protein